MENKKNYSIIALTVLFSVIGLFFINYLGRAKITGGVIMLGSEIDLYSTFPAMLIIVLAIIGLVYMIYYLKK